MRLDAFGGNTEVKLNAPGGQLGWIGKIVDGFKKSLRLLPVLLRSASDQTHKILKIEALFPCKRVLSVIPKVRAVKRKAQRAVAVNEGAEPSVSKRYTLVPAYNATSRGYVVLLM